MGFPQLGRCLAAMTLIGMLLAMGRAQAPTPATAGSVDQNRYYEIQQLDVIHSMQDKLLSVKGKVADFKPTWKDTAPNIITLSDGGAKIFEVVYWNPQNLEVANFSQPGTDVYATGEVQLYRGRWQLKVEDLKNISDRPLPPERMAGSLAAKPIATPDPKSATPAPTRPRIEWQAYSPLGAQKTLAEKGSVIIYARSESTDICKTFERGYLLHPDAVTLLGPRTIYFIDVQDPKNAEVLKALGVMRVPTLVVVQPNRTNRVLTFRQDMPASDVYSFFKGSPR